MADSKIPAHGESSVTFSVNGAKRGEGTLLLYPDELIAVNMRTLVAWVYLGVPAVYVAVQYYLFHTIGWGILAIWFLAGWAAWQALSKRRAASKVAAGGDGVTVIPLDLVTAVRFTRPSKVAGWLGIRNMTMTTADGTEYEFRGTTNTWPAKLARALAARGREVRTESEDIMVMPRVARGES